MSDATQTLELLAEGKAPKIMSLIPKGQSPKLYLDLVKTQIMGVDAKGNPRPDDDLLLFLYVAKRTGLDPLTKQIYAIYRWDSRQGREVMTIQASIDGMRLVAQRSKAYAGQEDVVYNDETAKWPLKATVTVYKVMGKERVPFTASARWAEYVQTNSKTAMPIVMWAKMPYLMLGKCAEALALRKAFPNELSGIYAPEEMAQSANVLESLAPPARFEKPAPEVISGAPADQSAKSDLNVQPDKVDPVPPEPPTQEPAKEPIPAPKVLLGTTEAPKPKDVAAMRAALKPKTIEEMQKAVKDMGKTAPKEQDPAVIGPH